MIHSDITYAFRQIYRQWRFSMAVTTVMALGIGACTAVFSLVNSVLLKDLPYDPDERLVLIWHTQGDSAAVVGHWARDYETYRDTTRAFDGVAAITTRGYNLNTESDPVRVTCSRVTANLFPMLGVSPLRGRWISEEEDVAPTPDTIVLSHRLWQSRFGGDTDLVGRSVQLDLIPHTVVGIMPESFDFPPEGVQGVASSECWVPAAFSQAELTVPAFNWVVVARLASGVSTGQAAEDTAAVTERILASYPAAVQQEVALRSRLVPLREQIGGNSRTPLLVFTGAVAILLLIGCVNVTNLMLARLQARQGQIAVRRALGARTSVLARQILAECVGLALCGGIGGVLVAGVMLRVLVIFGPDSVPGLEAAEVDPVALLFASGCSVFAGLLFGLAPVLKLRDSSIAAAMAHTRGFRQSGSRQRLKYVLVVTEIAMAVVLLLGAGLLLRSFVTLSRIDPGFTADNVMTFSVALPEVRYQQNVQIQQFTHQVLDRLRSLPAVRYAGVGSGLPIGPAEATVISRIDAPPEAAGYKPAAIQNLSPDYQRTMGIQLIQGRGFGASDTETGLPVAIINGAMAREHWPDRDPLGQRVEWLTGQRVLTVVGVAADVRQAGLEAPPIPTLYVPLDQTPLPVRNLVFVVRGDSRPVNPADIRSAVREADPNLPVFGLQAAERVLAASVAPARFNTFVVSVFAASALTLAAVGLYAVIAYVVSQSSRSFGIRIALGATSSRILGMVLLQGLGLTGVGLLIGATAGFWLTRLLSSMLFRVSPNDSLTFGVVFALVLVVALLATLRPAIRAARVDPIDSLRQE